MEKNSLAKLLKKWSSSIEKNPRKPAVSKVEKTFRSFKPKVLSYCMGKNICKYKKW
jgi:hypothetical protein